MYKLILMNIISRTIKIAILAALFANVIIAQNKPVRFDKLTTSDGLSQNRVFDIVQDNHGFIWIGTEDGLNRYDGYEFKVYKKVPSDTNSLADNVINTLHISSNGDLWAGTSFGGLSKFDYDTETFTNYISDNFDPKAISGNTIRDISEDKFGNIWIVTPRDGFDYFDIRSNTFYHMENILPKGFLLTNRFLNIIHQDKHEYLWVGGEGKINVFKISYSNNIPRLQPIKVENQIFDIAVSCIEEDEKGDIWIGTVSSGLFKYNREKNILEPFIIKDSESDFKNIIVAAIETDLEKNLWIASSYYKNGLDDIDLEKPSVLKINLTNSKIQKFQYDSKDESSITNSFITKIYSDRSGVLWFGSDLAGINKYDNSVIKFNLFEPKKVTSSGVISDAVRAFVEDKNGILWAASASNGLLSYDKSSKKFQYFSNDPNDNTTLSNNFSSALYDDGKYLWVGTFNGLNRFDKQKKTFQRFYVDPEDKTSRLNSVNYNIIELEDQPGFLWYGSNGAGLVKFNKNDYSFKTYTYDPESEKSLNSRANYVRFVLRSKSNPKELWTGTTNGINIFNLEDESFRYYVPDLMDTNSLSHQNVMNIYEDEKGYFWISTYGGGLNRFDPKSETFLRFTEMNSDIPNNGVYGVLPDGNGNFWLSTNNGISKFNPNTFQFRNYTVDDGLQSEEFNGGSLYKSPSGEMYFGGINGFNSFYPSKIKDNNVKPELVITDLKLFNESLKNGKDSPLKKQISNTDEIVLAYWQNDISFDYVGLHYANPKKNRYAFKLENYEDEWRYVKNARTATYTNLDPGEYVFRVKGSNNDGLWNEEGKSIKLIISPPWWRTYWAYAGYLLLFGLVIFTIDRIQRARLLSIEKRKAQFALLEAENKRKSEELEEARQLQLSMLPKELPQLPNLDIAVYMQTATEVGGDYYDFHIGLDGTLTVVLGDATGHGMKAGTMVTTTKSLFNVLAPNPNIVETFHEMTRCLKLMQMEKLSMCMTMLKITGNTVQMSAAGMPPVFIYKKENQTIEEHVMKGMPLGTFNNFPYSLIESELGEGDTILLMSDGFPELLNDNKEMYGYKRARNLFEELAIEAPEDIISKLKTAGSEWVKDADPDDDVTFVVIKVK